MSHHSLKYLLTAVMLIVYINFMSLIYDPSIFAAGLFALALCVLINGLNYIKHNPPMYIVSTDEQYEVVRVTTHGNERKN